MDSLFSCSSSWSRTTSCRVRAEPAAPGGGVLLLWLLGLAILRAAGLFHLHRLLVRPRRRERLPAAVKFLLTTLIINFSILASSNTSSFLSIPAASPLTAMGLHANPPVLRVILPVGVSFYTFQTDQLTSSTFTARERRAGEGTPRVCRAVRQPYFPHLVAGPIDCGAAPACRSFRAEHRWDHETGRSQPACMLDPDRGFFKKVVDRRLAPRPSSSAVYDWPARFQGAAVGFVERRTGASPSTSTATSPGTPTSPAA